MKKKREKKEGRGLSDLGFHVDGDRGLVERGIGHGRNAFFLSFPSNVTDVIVEQRQKKRFARASVPFSASFLLCPGSTIVNHIRRRLLRTTASNPPQTLGHHPPFKTLPAALLCAMASVFLLLLFAGDTATMGAAPEHCPLPGSNCRPDGPWPQTPCTRNTRPLLALAS